MLNGYCFLSFFQLHGEVSQDFRFPGDVVAFLYFFASVKHILDGDCDIIHVVVRVGSARDGEPNEFEFRVTVFPRLRIAVCQKCPDFYGADSGFLVNLVGKGLRRIFFTWDVW